jgi:predicted alpha/beta hydrolase
LRCLRVAEYTTQGTGHLSKRNPINFKINTTDGVELSGRSYMPERAQPRAVIICAHAMMVDLRTFEKSGFAQTLASRGYVVCLFNFRGRDLNGPKDWSYDDLVCLDVPAVISTVAQRHPDLPCIWLGHSLGGHVGLAAQRYESLRSIQAMVLVSTNVWLPSLEHHTGRRLRKALYMLFGRIVVRLLGTIPVKKMRFGTVNESATYLKDLISWWRRDRWTSAIDGGDYLSYIKGLSCPLLSVVGAQDKLEAHPVATRAFLSSFEPEDSTLIIADEKWSKGRAPADHMRLITSKHSAPGWQRICDWLDQLKLSQPKDSRK